MQPWPYKWFGFLADNPNAPKHFQLSTWQDPDWGPARRADIISYLATAPVALVGAMPEEPCPLCGVKLSVACFQTNNEWLWPCRLVHDIESHDVFLPPELVAAIAKDGYRPPVTVTLELNELPFPSNDEIERMNDGAS